MKQTFTYLVAAVLGFLSPLCQVRHKTSTVSSKKLLLKRISLRGIM